MPVTIEPHEVTSTPVYDADAGAYFCRVTPMQNERTGGKQATAIIAPSAHGSVILPPEGTRVIVADTESGLIILGTLPSPNDGITTPAAEAGERVESHGASDATITYRSDGTISIDGDTDVIINGGSTRPVTDVSTTTDADGHVTDITLTRASNVYVPE